MTRAAIAAALVLLACEREDRDFQPPAPSTRPVVAAPFGTLVAGPVPNMGAHLDPAMPGYQETSYNVAQGGNLYLYFNCVGCHANGGGGMGPPFLDEKWIYGSRPYDVATSIIAGRPNGMPSYRGKIAPQQLYQLVAYVRTLGGLVRTDAVPARQDHAKSIPAPTLHHEGLVYPSRPTPEGP